MKLGTAWELLLEKTAGRRNKKRRRRDRKHTDKTKGIFGMLGGPRGAARASRKAIRVGRGAVGLVRKARYL